MTSTDPIHNVEDALARIDAFAGPPTEFLLPIHEALLDPIGLNMALITDRILSRGWQPDGFSTHSGCRVFRYKELS